MKLLCGLINKMRRSSLKDEFKVIWKFFYNNVFAYALLYIQNVLINKYMPVEALGKYSYGQSMLVLFASVYSMEVYSAYLRYVGCNNEKELLKTSRKILTIASALFCITVLLYFKNPFYIVFMGYMWMRERLYFFRAKLDIASYGKIKIIQYLLSIVFIVILSKCGILGENTLLITMGLSYLIVSLLYTFNKKAKKIICIEDDLPVASTKELVIYALPLAFNAIVVWLLGAADQMLIDKYLDDYTLTYYSVGFRIIGVIRIGVGVIMEYWPRFYFERMDKKQYGAIKKMYMGFVGVVLFFCVGSIIFSKPIYWLLGASQYTEKRWMFCMLALSELFRQIGSINMTFQSYMKNNFINVVCLSVLGGIKLLINVLFIERLGVSVLFQTTLMCYFLYFVCSLYFGSYKEKKHNANNTNM